MCCGNDNVVVPTQNGGIEVDVAPNPLPVQSGLQPGVIYSPEQAQQQQPSEGESNSSGEPERRTINL